MRQGFNGLTATQSRRASADPTFSGNLCKQRNAEVLLDDVVQVDLLGRYVISELPGHRYRTEYDSLIMAAVATQAEIRRQPALPRGQS